MTPRRHPQPAGWGCPTRRGTWCHRWPIASSAFSPPGSATCCWAARGRPLRPGGRLRPGRGEVPAPQDRGRAPGSLRGVARYPASRRVAGPSQRSGDRRRSAQGCGGGARPHAGRPLPGPGPRRRRGGPHSGATFFCFPRLAEGFGLHPLEALACVAPVLCSDAPALPEAMGEAACLVNARLSEALAAALEGLRCIPAWNLLDQVADPPRDLELPVDLLSPLGLAPRQGPQGGDRPRDLTPGGRPDGIRRRLAPCPVPQLWVLGPGPGGSPSGGRPPGDGGAELEADGGSPRRP